MPRKPRSKIKSTTQPNTLFVRPASILGAWQNLGSFPSKADAMDYVELQTGARTVSWRNERTKSERRNILHVEWYSTRIQDLAFAVMGPVETE